jgi:tetratricopeptide (TPR) repeat protein
MSGCGHGRLFSRGREVRENPARALLVATISLLLGAGCSSSPEAKAAKALKQGKTEFAQKNYSRAALEFRIAARNLPKSGEPLYQLSLVYLEVGDVTSAVQALIQANKVDPNHLDSQIKLAQLMALNQDPEAVKEAERRARAVMAVTQGNPDAIATLALAELRLGETESAEQHLKEALSRFPQDLKSSLLLAMLKIDAKDLPAAENVLKKAVEQAPKSADPLVALGRFYMMSGKLAEAETQIGRALLLDANNSLALLDLASIQLQRGQKDQAEKTYSRLSQIPDKRYRPVHATYLFQVGRQDEAIAEFVRLEKADPKDRAVRTQLVAAYLATRRVADAEKVLTAALKRNPRDTDALLQRSEIYLLGGKLEGAQNDLNNVLAYHPDSAQAHYVLGRLFLAQGSQLNQRRELMEALKLDPGLLAARIDLAQSLIAARDPRAAADLMRQSPAGQKDNLLTIVQMNWALWAMGEVPEMTKGVERGLAIARVPDLLLQQALIKLQSKDYKAARPLLTEALKINREDLRALELLARSYVAENQPDVALATIRQYAAQPPRSAPIQQFLGMWLAANGNRDEARSAFETAKSADANYLGADFALAQLDLTEGKIDPARQRLSGILASNPRNLDATLLLGMVEELAGRYEVAIVNYRKVLETEPSNLYALNNIAYRLANDGNAPDEALKYAQKAVEVGPTNLAVQDTIGWAYYRKGLYKEAVRYLTTAAQGSTAPVRLYHLAMAYEKAGDDRRARQTLDLAMKMDANLPEAKVAQAVLHGQTK